MTRNKVIISKEKRLDPFSIQKIIRHLKKCHFILEVEQTFNRWLRMQKCNKKAKSLTNLLIVEEIILSTNISMSEVTKTYPFSLVNHNKLLE